MFILQNPRLQNSIIKKIRESTIITILSNKFPKLFYPPTSETTFIQQCNVLTHELYNLNSIKLKNKIKNIVSENGQQKWLNKVMTKTLMKSSKQDSVRPRSKNVIIVAFYLIIKVIKRSPKKSIKSSNI